MILIDTSVLVELLRDRTSRISQALQDLLDGRDFYLSRFTQLELLQGARDHRQWLRLSEYLEDQDYLEMEADGWNAAAKIYVDLRRQGLTVRSVIDCCIADLAMRNDAILLHNDRDFETIARVKSLRHLRFQPEPAMGFHEPPPADLT
jgi:predicted nucleic acid-binding protein